MTSRTNSDVFNHYVNNVNISSCFTNSGEGFNIFFVAIDPCSGVVCGDNANCVNGTCVCESGFEGDGNVCTRK